MHTASSAKRTCRACASASEWMATVAMPISRAARSTRTAISPRFAISIFRNIAGRRRAVRGKRRALGLFDAEKLLPELDRTAGFDQAFEHHAGELRFDLVHELHGFDDAERLARLDGAAHVDERGRVGG